MKQPKKVVSYRIRETTIEKVRKDAKTSDLSINDYVDKILSEVKSKKP